MERWYALYTKPNREMQVYGLLLAQGLEAYVPTVLRKVRRRDRPDRKVFFPCYLFAHLDFQVTPHSTIAWLPGVRRIVSSGDQPAVVSDEIVDLIRHKLEGVEETAYSSFRKGDRVRVTTGPLRDLEAIFDRPVSAEARVRILLDVMGRLTPVELDGSQIVRLE